MNKLTKNPGLVRTRMFGNMTRRQFGMGAAAATAGAGLAGLPAGKALAASDLYYTGWQGYDDGLNVDGWFAKNDITLQTTYITAGNEEIIANIQQGGKGNMDIVTPAALYVPFYNHVNLLEPLDKSRFPNYSNLFSVFQNMSTLEIDGKVLAIPFTWGSVPLMYNADVITEPPTSWTDVMKPEYKGKVGLVHDMIAMTDPFGRVAANTATPWLITEAELDATIDLLIEIKKNHARAVYAGYGELGTAFANGEIVMAPAWEPTSVWGGAENTNLKWVIPEEGALLFVDALAVVPDAPHLDACYEVLNHSLTPEANANVANLNMTGQVIEAGVPLLDDLPRNMYAYDDIDAYVESAGGFSELYPTLPDGTHVTFDQVAKAWERFLVA